MRVPLLVLFAVTCAAQDFTQRGFAEIDGTFYPQAAPNDSGHAVAELLLREEMFYKPIPMLQFAAGVDARTDSHLQVERRLHLSWWDRETQHPAFAIREANVTLAVKKLTVQLGKQFIRWGKADLLNPTDRFAPRDYLNVVENEPLGVTAARLTYGGALNTLEVVWMPRFTPSRVPLLDQRWTVLPVGLPVQELAPAYPGGSQFGGRWNHAGRLAEFSLSAFEGYNHLPSIRGDAAAFQHIFPRIRSYGADTAVPLKWLTFRGEGAYFMSPNHQSDEYLLYVLQLERQAGEWFFTAGYAGETVTRPTSLPDFNPDRGLTRSFLAHAGYTIDANRSVNFEAIVRQNGSGEWIKAEYSQSFGQHWRASVSAGLIRGHQDDFLGQYRRNSYALLRFRYSF